MLTGRCEPLGSRSAGCRRSFSDEPPYRSPLATRAQAMRTHRTESLSDGPNPLLKDSGACRRPSWLARGWPWQRLNRRRMSHTGSPTTAKRALQMLSVAPKSRSVLVMQPPTGGCTTMRVSALRTSRRGQPAGRARRQLDSAPREVTKASSARAGSRDYQSTPMDLEHGISALDQKPRRRAARGPTSGRRSSFFSGRFVRRSARADEGRTYHLIL